MTRAATRTTKKTAAAPPPKRTSVSADFLNSFTQSLEEVEQAGCGYGELKAAVITTQENENGPLVTATYEDRGWSITITEAP